MTQSFLRLYAERAGRPFPQDPAVRKRYEDGPVGTLTLIPNGPPAMGKYLALWFVFCFLVSFVTAYVARNTLSYDTDPMTILRITAAVACAPPPLPDRPS